MELLKTKFFIPTVQPALVSRQRLLEHLNTGLHQKLTLLSAPAGFGKTTLLSEWVHQLNRPAAWLSLDDEENESGRFWSYFLAALQTMHPAFGENILATLQSPQLPPLEAIVTALLNELAAAPTPWLLVLDDYHTIQTEAIHQSLNFLIDQLPPSFQLVIATREDPPLALPRRRARRELSEIRVKELRFTADETDQFFKNLAGLELAADDIATLDSRTEGWVVGLQMAAISLRTLPATEKKAFITAFSGNDRYIGDYLVEEVLHRLPTDIQAFLLHTSVLDRLCGALCQALTGRTDSDALLAELERANLFTLSLDNQRCWYRYHHLFADLLRRRLALSSGPQAVAALYQKASAWFEQQGLIDQAVKYALASNAGAYAADVIERHVLATFYRSETLLVHTWLKALPVEVLSARPLLCAVYASTTMLFLHGSLKSPETQAQIESWLQRAEAGLAPQTPTGNLASHYIDNMRVYLARLRGDDLNTVIVLTLGALARLPENEVLFRCALTTNLGLAYTYLGNRPAAQQAYREAIQAGIASHDLFNVSAAWCQLAMLALNRGHLRKAVRLCREGLQAITQLAEGQPVPYAGVINIVLGTARLNGGELEEAEQELARGLAKLKLTYAQDMLQWGYCDMAYINYLKGNLAEAMDGLDMAANALPDYADMVNLNRVSLWLNQAAQDPPALAAARQWAHGRELRLDSQDNMPDWEQLTLARVLITRLRMEPAATRPAPRRLQQFLEQHLALARQTDLLRWQIDILVLQALTWQALKEFDQALTALHSALRLAEPESYVRVFWEAGAPLADLLQRAAWPDVSPAYLDKLLFAYKTPQTKPPAKPLVRPLTLAEPLSTREAEILRLIVAGDANPEIAQKLGIAISTVKTHINNIFGKLGAATRTQAVARARQLGLAE